MNKPQLAVVLAILLRVHGPVCAAQTEDLVSQGGRLELTLRGIEVRDTSISSLYAYVARERFESSAPGTTQCQRLLAKYRLCVDGRSFREDEYQIYPRLLASSGVDGGRTTSTFDGNFDGATFTYAPGGPSFRQSAATLPHYATWNIGVEFGISHMYGPPSYPAAHEFLRSRNVVWQGQEEIGGELCDRLVSPPGPDGAAGCWWVAPGRGYLLWRSVEVIPSGGKLAVRWRAAQSPQKHDPGIWLPGEQLSLTVGGLSNSEGAAGKVDASRITLLSAHVNGSISADLFRPAVPVGLPYETDFGGQLQRLEAGGDTSELLRAVKRLEVPAEYLEVDDRATGREPDAPADASTQEILAALRGREASVEGARGVLVEERFARTDRATTGDGPRAPRFDERRVWKYSWAFCGRKAREDRCQLWPHGVSRGYPLGYTVLEETSFDGTHVWKHDWVSGSCVRREAESLGALHDSWVEPWFGQQWQCWPKSAPISGEVARSALRLRGIDELRVGDARERCYRFEGQVDESASEDALDRVWLAADRGLALLRRDTPTPDGLDRLVVDQLSDIDGVWVPMIQRRLLYRRGEGTQLELHEVRRMSVLRLDLNQDMLDSTFQIELPLDASVEGDTSYVVGGNIEDLKQRIARGPLPRALCDFPTERMLAAAGLEPSLEARARSAIREFRQSCGMGAHRSTGNTAGRDRHSFRERNARRRDR